MINPLPIINIAKSSHKALKKYKREVNTDPFSPEIKKLREEIDKWTIGINMIGRECPNIGDTAYEIEENAINSLSAIEGVVIPLTRYNIFIPNKVYFYTDPNKIKEIKLNEDSSLIEKIYPQPEKARLSIEKVVNDCIAESLDHGYINGFKIRKNEIIKELVFLRKSITTPYTPGMDYSSVQKAIAQTSKKMAGIEYDYLANIYELEYQRSLRRLKIGAKAVVATGIALVLGDLISSKFKGTKH
jgi:hypothetical protein